MLCEVKTGLILFLKQYDVSKAASSAVQILYLQETPVTSSSVIRSATVTSQIPNFESSNQYAWSAWFYKTSWISGWGRIFRLALDTRYSMFCFQIKNTKLKFSQSVGTGRIAGSHIFPTVDTVFTGSQTGTSNYDWDGWEGVILL